MPSWRPLHQPVVDGCSYCLYVSNDPDADTVLERWRQLLEVAALDDMIEIVRKSPDEMAAIASSRESGESPAVLLEKVVSGPTSAVLQCYTPAGIVAELCNLARERHS